MFKLILFIAFVISSASANLAFTNCGSTADLHALRVIGCNATPCTFTRGTTYTIEIDATARSASINLPFEVQGITAGLLPPITVLTGNACQNLWNGSSCPAVNGNRKYARILYTVGNLLPAISLQVRFTVRDDFNQVVICGQFAANITG